MHHTRRLQAATMIVAALMVVGGLPALASTIDASTPAQVGRSRDATQLTITAKAPTRARATIRGTRYVATMARPARLQQLVGTDWTVVKRARTKRSGRVAYRITPPPVTTSYRIFAPATVVLLSLDIDGRPVTRRVRLAPWTSRVRTITVPTQEPTQTPTQTPTQEPTQTPTQTPTHSPTHSPTNDPTNQPTDTPWVTGYYAAWFWQGEEAYAPEDVDMDAMTHFVFGRVAPGGGSLGGEPGDLEWGAVSAQETPGQAPDGSGRSVEDYLVDRAHEAGTSALLMLGGDGGDGRGFMLSAADDRRAEFVETIVDYLVQHDYDGVDLDWENCLDGGAGCGETDGEDPVPAAEARRRLMALISDLRAETDTRGRYAEEAALITFPGYPLSINDLDEGAAPQWQADVANAVDQYNLMSYGVGTTFNGGGWDSWFSGALHGASGTHPVDIESSVDAYVAAGVPRDRIGIGIGFYGIYWGPSITGPRQNTDTNDIWETDDSSLGYGDLDRMGYLDHGTGHWDDEAQATYRTYAEYGDGGYVPPYNPQHPLDSTRYPAGFLSYEDARSIQAKGDWVQETGVGGTIVWTINYGWVPRTGTNPLLDAVRVAFLQ